MVGTNVYYPHAVKLPGGNIFLFDTLSWQGGQQTVQVQTGSDYGPCTVYVASTEPRYNIGTSAIDDVLSYCTDGNIANAIAANGMVAYYGRGKPKGLREALASALHFRTTVPGEAMIYWDSLNAAQDQLATVSVVLKMIDSTGLLSATTFVDDIAMDDTTSGGAAPAENCQTVYTLGAVQINGTTIDSITNVQISNNVSESSVMRHGGHLNPRYANISRVAPQLQFTTNNLADVYDALGGATAVTGAPVTSNVNVFLRKKSISGGLVAPATTEHLRLQYTAGLLYLPSMDGTDPVEAPITFEAAKTEGFANNLFAYDNAVAHPTA